MRLTVLALSAALLAPLVAVADDDSIPPITDPLVKKECGECHMAFQPRFLPAVSWRKIMASLDNHFGENAGLEAGTRDKIESYLVAHAGRWRVDSADPPLRITDFRWFHRAHREGELKRLRSRQNVKTMADCVACHRGANRGYFENE